MTTLDDFHILAAKERGLVVVSTLRADGTIQASLVNAGLLLHPVTGQRVCAFITYGKVKLSNLRVRPQTTITARSGWAWATIEGTAQLIGPDDPAPDIDRESLRMLLRDVFRAAGGTHEDWDEYDRVMADQRRAVVFVLPVRIYSN